MRYITGLKLEQSEIRESLNIHIRFFKKEAEIVTAVLEEHRPKTCIDTDFMPIGLDEPYRVIISEDPIGFEGGINFYVYVGNNPVNFTDPSGLVGPAVIGIGIGIRVCLSNPACSSAVLAGGAALGAALGNLLRDLPPPEKCDEEFWDCELIYKRPKDLPKHGVRALECTYSCKSNKGRQLIVTRVVFAENCPAKPSGF